MIGLNFMVFFMWIKSFLFGFDRNRCGAQLAIVPILEGAKKRWKYCIKRDSHTRHTSKLTHCVCEIKWSRVCTQIAQNWIGLVERPRIAYEYPHLEQQEPVLILDVHILCVSNTYLIRPVILSPGNVGSYSLCFLWRVVDDYICVAIGEIIPETIWIWLRIDGKTGSPVSCPTGGYGNLTNLFGGRVAAKGHVSVPLTIVSSSETWCLNRSKPYNSNFGRYSSYSPNGQTWKISKLCDSYLIYKEIVKTAILM